jgi:hypothetical protein
MVTKWHTKQSKNYPQPTKYCRHHLNDFHWEAVHWDPINCRIKSYQNLHIQCTKRLSECRCALHLQWVLPPTVRRPCSIWINDIPPKPLLVDSSMLKWWPASHIRTDGYDDASCERSHRCRKSRPGTIVMRSRLSAFGHLLQQSVDKQNNSPQCIAVAMTLTIVHSRISCMQNDNQSWKEMVCRWSKSRTKLHNESWANHNSNSEIGIN